jgi:hypothetical protein
MYLFIIILAHIVRCLGFDSVTVHNLVLGNAFMPSACMV